MPMDEIALGLISVEGGLSGDYKGAKFPLRQITVLAREAWEAAAAQIGESGLPWTTRRANLLVEGVELPRAKGGLIGIGPVRLEVGPDLPLRPHGRGQGRAAEGARQGVARRVDLPGPVGRVDRAW